MESESLTSIQWGFLQIMTCSEEHKKNLAWLQSGRRASGRLLGNALPPEQNFPAIPIRSLQLSTQTKLTGSERHAESGGPDRDRMWPWGHNLPMFGLMGLKGQMCGCHLLSSMCSSPKYKCLTFVHLKKNTRQQFYFTMQWGCALTV